MVFGIPNMAVLDMSGEVLENKQLEPDILIKNEFDPISNGKDQQLKRAIQELLDILDSND
jgi:C-terminal processing protease CtpA/Prc